jgi:hypothetical protein
MLGRFKGKVVSAGITSYVDKKDGQTKPRFVVKVQCITGPNDKDAQGKQVQSFIREWSATYVEGDNRKYTDEALMLLGYLYGDEGFADFDDIVNGWNSEAEFEAVVHEEPGKDQNGNEKMFEKIKSIWRSNSTEVKNALAKDDVVNVMKGLSLPSGHAAAMRERIKEKNGGKLPGKKPAEQKVSTDASFASDDIPF